MTPHSLPDPSQLTFHTADRHLQELIRQPVPDWGSLHPWLFTSGSHQDELAAWVLSRLAGVHMYWSLMDEKGKIPAWHMEFLPAGTMPSPARSMVMELISHPLPPPTPDATLQIVRHMAGWLRCGTSLSQLVQRNGYALMGRMAQAMLPGSRAAESRALREELVFRYTSPVSLPLQGDILQHLTDYWLSGLRPGSRMPDEELFYGLFFLRQEAARISPLRSLVGHHYLHLAEMTRRFRPELATSIPYQDDYDVTSGSDWELLPRLQETGLTGILVTLERKRGMWEPTPLLSRLLELKPDYIESEKNKWREVLSSLVTWSCSPEVLRHYPGARLEVGHFIERIGSTGLIPDDCARWMQQLSFSSALSPSSPPSPSCTTKFWPGITS